MFWASFMGSDGFRSRRVVTGGALRPAAIHIADGKIAQVSESFSFASIDYGDLVIMPGLVDTHVHINEPGRTDWEGFATATRAAAAGGITTLIEMPLKAIPATTSVASIRGEGPAAAGSVLGGWGFWGGVGSGNTAHSRCCWQAGCWGFKCFLTPSGVAEFRERHGGRSAAAMPDMARTGAVPAGTR